jgi:hypothetical protein
MGSGMIVGLMVAITDRFGACYEVTSARLGAGAMVYHVHAGELLVARAVPQIYKGCISDVLVYRQIDRRRGICSALYAAIEADIGRPLIPSRIKSKCGKAFWASRR